MILPRIAVTIGEPAGIGPDLCVRLAERTWPARLVLIGDIELLRERARRLGAGVQLQPYAAGTDPSPTAVDVLHVPIRAPVVPGSPDPRNARTVLATLDRAVDECLNGGFAAMVTAPVQKSAINAAGIPFTGHTEYLAERTQTEHVVMLLVGDGDGPGTLRVALATTHLPLSAVPGAITRDGLQATFDVVQRDLQRRFGIARPRIAVCGLNPHAGEGGYLGREDVDVITPAIADFRARGGDVDGPLPADTVFVPMHARRYDCIVAMFHDQGLPVLKAASFGVGINVTLGLPLVRTSVDHGTALDLAANAASARRADPGSLRAATSLAIALAGNAARIASPSQVAAGPPH
jgi:4-hydroxythreonine-4-phosphate dehydrogenase